MVKNKSKDPTKDDPSEVDSSVNTSKKPIKSEVVMAEQTPTTVPGIRVGGRMKKAKVVFDPSDNYMPKRKLTAAVNVEANKGKSTQIKRSSVDNSLISYNSNNKTNKSRVSNPHHGDHKNKTRVQSRLSSDAESTDANYYSGLCLICLKPGQESDLLNCSVMFCNYKAHLTCLNLSNDEFDLALLQNQWQCPHCKTCVVCFENAEAGNLTVCSVCGDAYHSICHMPRISSNIDSENWKCVHCTNLSLPGLMRHRPSNSNASTPSSSTTNQCSPTIKKESGGEELGNGYENHNESPRLIAFHEIKKENAEHIIETIPLTPPPSQPSQSVASSNDDTIIKDIKDEFAGFSDVESSPKENAAVTKNNLGIKSNSLKRKSINDCDIKVKNENDDNLDGTLDKKKMNLRSNNCTHHVGNSSNGSKFKDSNSIHKLDEQLIIFQEDFKVFNGKAAIRIPDASEWTCDDVYSYFRKYFPDEATIFKDQEIDGSSLLLMKRSDVIGGLNIKLGPALKIYRHVVMLQSGNNDPRLSWL